MEREFLMYRVESAGSIARDLECTTRSIVFVFVNDTNGIEEVSWLVLNVVPTIPTLDSPGSNIRGTRSVLRHCWRLQRRECKSS